MFFGPTLGEVEGEAQDAVDAVAREHGLLEHGFAFGTFEQAAADRGVFAFGVFAHDVEVDVAHLAASERAGHAGHQTHRTQVDVLVEFAPKLDQ